MSSEGYPPKRIALSPCCNAPLSWVSYDNDGEPTCTGLVPRETQYGVRMVRCGKVYKRSEWKGKIKQRPDLIPEKERRDIDG